MDLTRVKTIQYNTVGVGPNAFGSQKLGNTTVYFLGYGLDMGYPLYSRR